MNSARIYPSDELVTSASRLSDFGARVFVDLDNYALESVGEVGLVFDVIGGDIANRSERVIRSGGPLVTITGPTEARSSGTRTIDFVVEPDCAQFDELVQRFRDGRSRINTGKVAALDDAVAALNRTERTKRKTILLVRPNDWEALGFFPRASSLPSSRRNVDS